LFDLQYIVILFYFTSQKIVFQFYYPKKGISDNKLKDHREEVAIYYNLILGKYTPSFSEK